jgi:polyhydroxyalkanoate synthase
MTDPPERRRGPRPLALHLAAAAALWTASSTGWRLWSAVSPRSSEPASDPASDPGLPPELAAMKGAADALARLPPDVAAEALRRAVRDDADAFLTGIARYRASPWRREVEAAPVVWRQGTSLLRDYGPAGAPVLLVVPSLVNRAYVLDLTPETSLLRFLARQGLRPLLLEWDAPAPDEASLTLTDIVAGRMERALEAAVALQGGPVGLLGYCMGGTLAAALAARRPAAIAALVAMAAPWDFHAGRPDHVISGMAATAAALPWLLEGGVLPVDTIQALLMTVDPLSALRKFKRFGRGRAEGAAAGRFVALEDWLNDGIPLPGPVAAECLAGWFRDNTPAQGEWRIADQPVRPRAIACASLHLIPAQDRIVPPASARALADAVPGARTLDLPLGHIGMAVSSQAPALTWAPLSDWLLAALPGPAVAPGRGGTYPSRDNPRARRRRRAQGGQG